MKWKTAKKHWPKNGDERIRRKFAWFPVEIHDYTYWLEFYYVREAYVYRRRATKAGPIHCYGWDEIEVMRIYEREY
jgi:hypothetical protein